MYSRDNIKEAIAEGHLKIYPFEEKNLTGIGYNISTTNFAFSINQGLLLRVFRDTSEQGYEHYVKIPPNDTILMFSKESLETDNEIAGTFHSKVSRVCQGLGHICTTLDPTWKGQLIIAINNPTNKEIRFDLDKHSGNILTMLIYKLDQSVSGPDIHDNNKGRCDLLLSHFTKQKRLWWRKKDKLELEEFIVHDFANSLNCYDDFMGENAEVDKYTGIVQELKSLKDRLENNLLIIAEKRYSLGTDGKYRVLRDKSERDLISNCSIFHLKNIGKIDLEKEYQINEITGNSKEVLNQIKQYLLIIDYELETINHIRRITWQNKKIEEYAAENSKLYIHNKKVKRLKKIILVVIIILLSSLILSVLQKLGTTLEESITKIILAVFTTLVAAIIARIMS
ncbi:MAG: hypothetical protein MR936_08150 [Eubacterium sp.]|nr:hypothetical protein [Eubacterium sp.]